MLNINTLKKGDRIVAADASALAREAVVDAIYARPERIEVQVTKPASTQILTIYPGGYWLYTKVGDK